MLTSPFASVQIPSRLFSLMLRCHPALGHPEVLMGLSLERGAVATSGLGTHYSDLGRMVWAQTGTQEVGTIHRIQKCDLVLAVLMK